MVMSGIKMCSISSERSCLCIRARNFFRESLRILSRMYGVTSFMNSSKRDGKSAGFGCHFHQLDARLNAILSLAFLVVHINMAGLLGENNLYIVAENSVREGVVCLSISEIQTECMSR